MNLGGALRRSANDIAFAGGDPSQPDRSDTSDASALRRRAALTSAPRNVLAQLAQPTLTISASLPGGVGATAGSLLAPVDGSQVQDSVLRRDVAQVEKPRLQWAQQGLELLASGTEVAITNQDDNGKPIAPLRLRDVAALLLELSPSDVHASHVEFLALSNPLLAALMAKAGLDGQVAFGTTIAIHATPAGARLLAAGLQAELRLCEAALEQARPALPGDETFLNVEELEALSARMKQARVARREALEVVAASPVKVAIAAAETEATNKFLAGDSAGAHACYAKAKRMLGALGNQAATLKLHLGFSLVNATVRAAARLLGDGDDQGSQELLARAAEELRRLRGTTKADSDARRLCDRKRCELFVAYARASTVASPSASAAIALHKGALGKAMAAELAQHRVEIERSYRVAIDEVKAWDTGDPEDKQRWARSLASEQHEKLALFAGQCGDTDAEQEQRQAAVGAYLDLCAVELKEALVRPGATHPIGTISAPTLLQVDEALGRGLGKIMSRLSGLPPTSRGEARDELMLFAEGELARRGGFDHVVRVREVLRAACNEKKWGDRALQARLGLLEGRIHERCKNHAEAQAAYERVITVLAGSTSPAETVAVLE